MKQSFGMLCLYHVVIFLVRIDSDMVFLYFHFGRNEPVSAGYGIRKLLPSIFAKLCNELFLRHVMIDPFCRKT